MMKNEIKTLKEIKKYEEVDKYRYPYHYVPEIIDDGNIIFQNEVNGQTEVQGYYIMKRYGINLDELFMYHKCNFS